MLAVHLVTVRLLVAAWTALEVSEEEGFQRVLRVAFYFTVASLKVPPMIVYDMVMNVLDTK